VAVYEIMIFNFTVLNYKYGVWVTVVFVLCWIHH